MRMSSVFTWRERSAARRGAASDVHNSLLVRLGRWTMLSPSVAKTSTQIMLRLSDPTHCAKV